MSFAADSDAMLNGPLGDDATYTPDGGSAVSVRVIRSRPDRDVDFGDARIRAASATFLMSVTAVPVRPSAGDTLVIGADTYTVQGTPARDERHLRWRVEARPA